MKIDIKSREVFFIFVYTWGWLANDGTTEWWPLIATQLLLGSLISMIYRWRESWPLEK